MSISDLSDPELCAGRAFAERCEAEIEAIAVRSA